MPTPPSWISLERAAQLDELIDRSYEMPCLIFKHSTKCFISDVALRRLESNWNFQQQELQPYFLDAIAQRPLSRQVCEVFDEHHETPQILLVSKGEVILEASKMDIHATEIAEMI